MTRAFLFVMDSFGIGNAPDAAKFGDLGSDTFGHIRNACENGEGDQKGLREGPLQLPNLYALGLDAAHRVAHNIMGDDQDVVHGFFGSAAEISNGKDTPTGHWEIASLPVPFDWGYFAHEVPAFPADLLSAIYKSGNITGSLGNVHASGTDVLRDFGEEHLESGKPIFYTSSDSVFQIAAHEEKFGLQNLYDLCEKVFALTENMNVGRVIARPFLGDHPSNFTRTPNRRDFAIAPPADTLLDRLVAAGHQVHAVGKIGDIFAHRGISTLTKASGNDAMFDAALAGMEKAETGSLTFVNFVDFDMLYGHRRDVAGYAASLEAFDKRLPDALARLKSGDLLIITADHGCDPTWRGTDHTREQVPIIGTLGGWPEFKTCNIGARQSFADIGETIAAHLGIPKGAHGQSFLDMIASDA